MALADDLVNETKDICVGDFTVNEGRVIPSVGDIPLSNEGRRINIVALFVDIRRSTAMTKTIGNVRAARVYKAYLRGIARISRSRGGSILSFNGDGVAIGFDGSNCANAAVLTALNINWFLTNVLGPRVDNTFKSLDAQTKLKFDFGIGIEMGEVLVVKGGIRGEDNNDLVWAGNPLNLAVKVSSNASSPDNIYITDAVYQKLDTTLTTARGATMWTRQFSLSPIMTLWRTGVWFNPDYIKTVPVTATPAVRALREAISPQRRALPAPPWDQ